VKKILLMLPAIGCTWFFNVLSYSQPNTSSGDKEAKTRISITITAKQATFKVGDPIVLNILVNNISEYKYCEKNIVETNHAEWNDYYVEVKDAEGNVVPRISKPLLPLRQRPELSGSRGVLCIVPGDAIKEKVVVDQIVNMSGPGTYYVQISHRDIGTDTLIRSNILQVNVAQ
jgi:hypothetical protein